MKNMKNVGIIGAGALGSSVASAVSPKNVKNVPCVVLTDTALGKVSLPTLLDKVAPLGRMIIAHTEAQEETVAGVREDEKYKDIIFLRIDEKDEIDVRSIVGQGMSVMTMTADDVLSFDTRRERMSEVEIPYFNSYKGLEPMLMDDATRGFLPHRGDKSLSDKQKEERERNEKRLAKVFSDRKTTLELEHAKVFERTSDLPSSLRSLIEVLYQEKYNSNKR